MKKWSKDEGVAFKNSEDCYGIEYNPGSGTIDIARITINDAFPGENKWGYLEEAHEMAVVISGEGYIESEKDGKVNLVVGDVIYVEPKEKFRWGGKMELIVPCGPAFTPEKHKIVEESK